MGDLIRISEAGGFLGITNAVTGAQFNVVDYFTPRTSASNRPQVFATTEAERLFIAQPTFSSVITANPLLFDYTTTLAARSNSFLLKANGPMTNVTMRITDTVSGVAFKYLPDKASWLDSSGGYDFIAGDNTVDLLDSPLPFDVGRALSLEIKGDSIDLLGTPTIPYFAAMLQNAEFRPIPYSSDIGNQEHPVTLRRDMPSLEDSLALANASLNSNSALWVVANNQIPASNRADAFIYALQAGFFDLDGNPLPTTPVAANTIQLRGGTVVRIFAQNDFRIVTAPVLDSDIVNSGEENVQSNWDESDNTKDSFILNKPTIPTARTDEEIRDVSAAQLTQGTGVDNLQVQIVKDDAADTVTFNLINTSTPPTTEEFYHGLSDSDNPATVVLTTLSQSDVGTGTGQTFDFSVGPASANDFIILLVPAAHDISTLINTGSGFSVLSSFTKTDNVRLINGDQYHSYVLGPLVDTYTADYRATLS